MLDGTDCVRLLTSDKEGGLVCVVRGERQLVCAGGFVTWSQTLEFPIELPAFPTKVSLPDDSTGTGPEIAFCAINEEGGLFCSAGITPLGGTDCSDVSLSDASRACSICQGTLECPNLSAVASTKQVVVVDGSAFWLDDEGEVHWPFSPEPVLPGKFVFFFLDDFQVPCGIREDGDLICALDSGATDFVTVPGPFVDGAGLIGDARCMIDPGGRATCFTIEDGDVVPAFAPSDADFTHVTGTQGTFCALTQRGTVVCWNGEGLLPEISDPLNE